MVSRRTNFGERSEPAPDRGGKLQSAGGAAQCKVSPLGVVVRIPNFPYPPILEKCAKGSCLCNPL